jgi:Adenosyl cobinamide kinase/adenosyl cobinamide phosphate guanylyltransferase
MFILVIGGAASGKSEYAENLAMNLCNKEKTYIATMQSFGEIAQEKIKRHKELRKHKGFKTVEQPDNLHKIPQKDLQETVLIECMSNLMANEMYDCNNESSKVKKIDPVQNIVNGIKYIQENSENIIVVTNEVFSDGIKYDEFTNKYIENLAKLNIELAKLCDKMVDVIYSIPIEIKSKDKQI